MTRRRWHELPHAVRQAIEQRAGLVGAVRDVAAGSVADFAATLETGSGTYFCKGVDHTNPQLPMQRNEARINPWLPDIAPRMRWSVDTAGWLVLGFDNVTGHHADLAVGSADLAAVAATLTELGDALTPCPPLTVQPATKRWAGLIEEELIDGDTLLHTDVSPRNFLIGDRVHVVDWSAPCRGAPWIDTALMVVRLIRAGHSPEHAEQWASAVPSWKQAPRHAVSAFATAIAGVYASRNRQAPAAHRKELTDAAHRWAGFRPIG